LLNSTISSRCPYNMVNCGPLPAEICWRVWGTPSNFNGFRVLASLIVTTATSLNGGHPNIPRCLALSWTGTLYVHFRRLLPPDGILPGAKFTLRPSFAFSYICNATAWHSSSGRQPNFAALKIGCHLYSTGRPSRWASAHIVVDNVRDKNLFAGQRCISFDSLQRSTTSKRQIPLC